MSKGSKNIYKLKSPWTENDHSIWLGASLGLHRNFDRSLFPSKLDNDKKKQLAAIVGSHVCKLKELDKPILIPAEEASPTEKEYLYEHFLSDESFSSASGGEGFIIDATGNFLATINIRDHLHLYYIDTSHELEEAWNKLEKIEYEIGKLLSYSFFPRFGFLTADPAECGTGMNVSIFLQLPALIHSGDFKELINENQEDAILVTGIYGTLDEIAGDVVLIKNNYTLGLSEEEILSSLRSFTTKLVLAEKAKRAKLMEADCPLIKDKVSRAYGLLEHSYQIEAAEALNAISLLKLGVKLGWITGVESQELNALFFNCRRGHILASVGEELGSEGLLHKRAELIHKVLKKAKLQITD